MRVGLLSGQVFSPLVKIGSLGVTGAALLSGMYAATEASLWDVMEGGSVGNWRYFAGSDGRRVGGALRIAGGSIA